MEALYHPKPSSLSVIMYIHAHSRHSSSAMSPIATFNNKLHLNNFIYHHHHHHHHHHLPTTTTTRTTTTTAAASATTALEDSNTHSSPKGNVAQRQQQESSLKCERDVQFSVGEAFYRSESTLGRDLGVLAAALHKRENGSLRVLDAMCGCGVRAMRYILHSGADFVLANDACKDLHPLIVQNLKRCSLSSAALTLEHCYRQRERMMTTETSNWKVTHEDANRLLVGRYLADDYFDLVDVDSFGSDSVCLRSALSVVRHGGILYVTSTDGFSSAGKRPYNALTAYGAFVRPMPFCNEIGLRMLIGGVVRDAAIRNLNVWPLFSYYSSHGPVFRVMLHVRQGIMDSLLTVIYAVLLKLCNGMILVM